MPALALVALNGKRDVCTFLIECYALVAPAEIDHVDSCGMAAFDHAVYGNNRDIAVYLFNHGANIARSTTAIPKNRLSILPYNTQQPNAVPMPFGARCRPGGILGRRQDGIPS